MRMRLWDLIEEHIAIQCHNIPDPDTLASGFGLYRFFEAEGRYKPKLFYGGPQITKPNLTAMISELGIPVEHATDLTEWDGLLITVDCQYGAGNVMPVNAQKVAVVDHHIQEGQLPPICDLRPWLGSCSTLVWSLLGEASFPTDTKLGTALHYGLFTDTNGFSEIRHPLDRDMWDMLPADQRILKKLKMSNLSLSDLSIAAAALNDLHFDPTGHFVIVSVPTCDPYLLGFISDLAMQVDSVDVVLAYSMSDGGVKLSVRTDIREAKASEIVKGIVQDIGSGGGHRDKAGGYITLSKYAERFGDMPLNLFFIENLRSHMEDWKVIDTLAHANLADLNLQDKNMKTYRKLPVHLGFVPCRKLFNGRADLQIRMREGDLDIVANDSTVLMIGLDGESYPSTFEKFQETYTVTGESFTPDLPYFPTVLNKNTGVRVSLMEFAEACVAKGVSTVKAMRLHDRVKVFTLWDSENYVSGDYGDWLVERAPNDLYVVTDDMFEKLYIRDCTGEDLSAAEKALRALKKGLSVSVAFAQEAGAIETLEGRISYKKGDALLTGLHKESWPVGRDYFFETYRPLYGIKLGADGKYRKKSTTVWAVQIHEAFMIELSEQRGTMFGRSGDWLLQYAPDEYGIVCQEIFEQTYEILR